MSDKAMEVPDSTNARLTVREMGCHGQKNCKVHDGLVACTIKLLRPSSLQARVFATVSRFHPSLMFAGKAGLPLWSFLPGLYSKNKLLALV
jgi:hypothetical protein